MIQEELDFRDHISSTVMLKWAFTDRRAPWIMRALRWVLAVALTFVATSESARFGVTGAAAIFALVLMGEVREWRARKRGLTQLTRQMLVIVCLLSTVNAEFLIQLFSGQWSMVSRVFATLAFGEWATAEIIYHWWLHKVEGKKYSEKSALGPPLIAQFLLYVFLPRHEREPILGDLDEDFGTNVLPKFGVLLARIWYCYKAILYASMYACENLFGPFARNVIQPIWLRAVLPLIKWLIAAFVFHKLSWWESTRAAIEKILTKR